MFKQFLQASALQFVQIDSCRLGSVNENLAVLLMAHKFQGKWQQSHKSKIWSPESDNIKVMFLWSLKSDQIIKKFKRKYIFYLTSNEFGWKKSFIFLYLQ